MYSGVADVRSGVADVRSGVGDPPEEGLRLAGAQQAQLVDVVVVALVQQHKTKREPTK